MNAADAGLREIAATGEEIIVQLHEIINPNQRRAALSAAPGAKLGPNQVRLPRGKGESWMADLQRLIEALPPVE